MAMAINAMTLLQLIFLLIMGAYFFNLLCAQQKGKALAARESEKEMERLKKMREISLSKPLSEKARPAHFSEIVGQESGLKALRAALCGKNPQHVIIYGPSGVGKTAAARLILDEAKKSAATPFLEDAKFVEIDGATARFDERGIADPLIGTVHDPIYQGAGALGAAGIPQPKAGAVTRAHGGILFIDEIGELHPIQLNKLLKVLEDRRVFLESSYYNSEDSSVPQHIHDIFQNGLPADFRLVGATTRRPSDIPEAVRSRCVEIHFRELMADEIELIAKRACEKINANYKKGALKVVQQYAANGRDAVSIIQMAAGIALGEAKKRGEAVILEEDAAWAASFGGFSPRGERRVIDEPQIGSANGMAVSKRGGELLEIEAYAAFVKAGGAVKITGIIENEEIINGAHRLKRQSMAKNSVDNVLTLLCRRYGIDFNAYDLHINFIGTVPVDGPSAGCAIALAVYSAVTNGVIAPRIAVTGEISLTGKIYPVGGIAEKIAAALRGGAAKIYIPSENFQAAHKNLAAEVIAISDIDELFSGAIMAKKNEKKAKSEVLAALGS